LITTVKTKRQAGTLDIYTGRSAENVWLTGQKSSFIKNARLPPFAFRPSRPFGAAFFSLKGWTNSAILLGEQAEAQVVVTEVGVPAVTVSYKAVLGKIVPAAATHDQQPIQTKILLLAYIFP